MKGAKVTNRTRITRLRGGPRWAVAWSVPPSWRDQQAQPDEDGNREQRRAARRRQRGDGRG